MREVERIDRILDLIKKIWTKYPDLRFNQLLDSLTWDYSKENNNAYLKHSYSKWFDEDGVADFKKDVPDVDLFYLEDDKFEQFLKSRLQ